MKFEKIFCIVLVFLFFSSVPALSEVSPNDPNSPLRILSSYSSSFSAGEKIPVKFTYKYSCPFAYAIHIYKDKDLSSPVCTKIVKGMGWITTNTYSGVVCQKTSEYNNTIEDVCGISSDAEDGSYTIRVLLFDKYNKPAVFDSVVGAVQIATNKPDLTVSSIEFQEETFVGQSIPIKVEVLNAGLRDSKAFNLLLYLSSDSGKTLIGEKSVPELKEKSSKQVEFLFDSSLLFPGEYLLEAVVDSGFEITEQNENNNLTQKSIFLTALSNYPDLVVDSVDFPFMVTQGEEIPVFVKVKNNGLTDVSENFIVSVLDSFGNSIESKVIYGLNSNQQKEIKFYVMSSGFNGKTAFSVLVDKLNMVNEVSKKNNSSNFSLAVDSANHVVFEKCYNDVDDDLDGLIDEGCKPDYSVELKDFIISPLNEKIFPVLDSSSKKQKFRFDSSQLPDFFVVPFELNVKFGENKDYLSEFDKKNFCVYVSDEKKEKELFLVFSGNYNENFPVLKETSFLSFVDYYGSSFSYFWSDKGTQEKLPESYVSSLYSRNFSGKEDSGFYFNPKLLGFDSGEFEINISSDCFGFDSDGVTSNDSKTLFFKIVSKEENNGIDDDDDGIIDNGFDLKLEDFSFEENILLEEKNAKAFLTVKNNGKFVSPQIKVYFFNGEFQEQNLVFSEKINSIGPDETQVFSFNLPSSFFSEVENKVIAFLDYDNSFAESDEFNNRLSSTLFKYSDSVSLKISEVNSDREIVFPKSNVRLIAKVKNNGFVDSSSFFVVVKDSLTKQVVDSVKVSNLQAGISLQNLKEKKQKKVLFGESKINLDDLSSITIEYDYSISGDLIGNRPYDVCISFSEEDSSVDSDNCKEIFFVVSSQADLRTNYFEPVNELTVKTDSSVLLELEMENKGVLDAENFSVHFYYYDKENAKKVINSISGFSLKSGEKENVMVSVDFSREINGSIFAELDPFNEIKEDDKTNNIDSVNLFAFLFEKCYNDVDDDLDGLIDEDCPESKFIVVSGDTIKTEFVLDVMQKEITIGKIQKVIFYHSVFGPLIGEKVTVITPSKESVDFFTGPNGSVSFSVDEIGDYKVSSSVKSAVLENSFKVISEEEASYSFVYVIAEFFFGSPDQTNPLIIPIILLLAFISSAYAFSRFNKYCFNLSNFFVVKPNYCTGFSFLISLIFFLIALFSNRFFGLIVFFVVLVLEFAFIYLFESYFLKKKKKIKSEKLINETKLIKKEKVEEKKDNGKKKAKFTLRL